MHHPLTSLHQTQTPIPWYYERWQLRMVLLCCQDFFFLLIELVAEEGTKVAIVSVSNEPIH